MGTETHIKLQFILIDLMMDDTTKEHPFKDYSLIFMSKWLSAPQGERRQLPDTIRTLLVWARAWWATLSESDKLSQRTSIVDIVTRRSVSAVHESEYLLALKNKLEKERDELYQTLHKGMYITPSFKGRFSPDEVNAHQIAVFGPFTDHWLTNQLPFYRDHLEKLGLTVVMAKEMTGEEIIEDIWHLAVTSEMCLVDLTGFNYNVFYELGLCHTLGKPTLIVIEREGDEPLRLPFNIQSRRVLAYTLKSYRGQKDFCRRTGATCGCSYQKKRTSK